MLEIYRELFTGINNRNIRCCVYKGLNHLAEDLSGERGDIDFLVTADDIEDFHALAVELGFISCRPRPGVRYYFGIDAETGKSVMLDVCTSVPAGPKPQKPYRLRLDFDSLAVVKKDIVPILAPIDYFSLMVLVRMMSQRERQSDLEELQHLAVSLPSKVGILAKKIEATVGKKWDDFLDEIRSARSWQDLQKKYYRPLRSLFDVDSLAVLRARFPVLEITIRRLGRVLGVPSYRIRGRGRLIAFIGVDGSGKSSNVEFLTKTDAMRWLGVKRIYFGSNEYWIPGLLSLLHRASEGSRWLKVIASTLALVDRQSRAVFALYYLLLGRIVLADRYFYDDFVGRMLSSSGQSSPGLLRRIYRFLFRPRMIITPDLTLFLDASPDIAYSRKQDYPKDHVDRVVAVYRNFMSDAPEVVVVGADRPQIEVRKKIIRQIAKCCA